MVRCVRIAFHQDELAQANELIRLVFRRHRWFRVSQQDIDDLVYVSVIFFIFFGLCFVCRLVRSRARWLMAVCDAYTLRSINVPWQTTPRFLSLMANMSALLLRRLQRLNSISCN